MTTLLRLLVLLCVCVSGSTFAQSYPDKPIRLIVPYPAGGGTDIAARWIAQKLGERLKQQVIVDNRGGANGNLGTDRIAKALPDGYTIGMGTPGPVTVGRSLYANLPYDPQRDLVPIILVNASPIVLVVNPAVPIRSIKDLVDFAKTNPGKLTAALVSTGSVPHLVTEMLKAAAGIDVLDIPYKGGEPAMMDVIGGQVDMLFSVLPLVLPYINSGKLRPLVVASETRSALLPDVPTTREAGYGAVVGSAWNGLLAPAGTPKNIVTKLNAEISELLTSNDTKDHFRSLGMEAAGGSPESFALFLQGEAAKWSQVVQAAHIQAN